MGKVVWLTDHFRAGINLVKKVVVHYFTTNLFSSIPISKKSSFLLFLVLVYRNRKRERSLLYFAQFRIVPLKLMTGAQIGSSAKLTPMLLLAEEEEEIVK